MGRGTAAGKRKQGEGSSSDPMRREEVPLDFIEELNERHAWLQFDGVRQPHKNKYLNKLHKLQKHPVCPPRYFTQTHAEYFGVQADIRQWFSLGMRVGDRVVNCEIWDSVFLNREPVYRELCLEFYATLRLTKELSKVKDIFEERCVVFYCGGQQRKLSIAEFGHYVGMYSREELNNPDLRNLLRKGLFIKADLGDGESIPQYWTRISGGENWPTGGYVSVSKIKSVKLRLLHRILVTSLIQRSSHWDKAYQIDLWLMKLFSEGSPRKFALPPMVLLDRMCNHSDSELVMGHYITRIYKRMGVFALDECKTYLSQVVYQVDLTTKELIRAKIVKKGQGNVPERLMDDDGVVEPPPPDVEEDVEMGEGEQEPQQRTTERRRVRTGGFDFTEMGSTMQKIYDDQQESRRAFEDYQRRMDQDMTWIGSQQAYTNYTLDYYQPMWHAQYSGEQFVPPVPVPEYRPPPVYVPSYRQGGQSFFPMTGQGDMSPRPHSLGGSPRGPVQFGSYQGVGTQEAGGFSSVDPGFNAGTSSGFVGGDDGSSSSGQEGERNWVTDLFGPPGLPYGYRGQRQ